MRVVIQRVNEAHVTISDEVVGEIGRGLLVLVGVATGDTTLDSEWLTQKIAKLRIFPDEDGQMNRSVMDLGADVLVVSQFTLNASTRKGTRPSFNEAAKPEVARAQYENFLELLEKILGRPVARGVFAAHMKVALVNDGPVTLIIDSRQRE